MTVENVRIARKLSDEYLQSALHYLDSKKPYSGSDDSMLAYFQALADDSFEASRVLYAISAAGSLYVPTVEAWLAEERGETGMPPRPHVTGALERLAEAIREAHAEEASDDGER